MTLFKEDGELLFSWEMDVMDAESVATLIMQQVTAWKQTHV